MKVAIRTDSSAGMGSGHLMRCLALAAELRDRGADISFICRQLPGNLNELIEKKAFQCIRLQSPPDGYVPSWVDVPHAEWLHCHWHTDATETIENLACRRPDWLIIDHYALDRRWESMLRPYAGRIMVIDDLADRSHDCDLLLDQNLYEAMESRYHGLLPEKCVTLLGPGYALLRAEFTMTRRNSRIRDGNIRRILIFLGGGDPTNETSKALEAVRCLNRPDIAVDVVVGKSNPHCEGIRLQCNAMQNTVCHVQIDNMAEVMAAADLAIGAGGSSSWERCFLGLPTMIIAIADHQIETSKCLDRSGCAWFCGTPTSTTSALLEHRLRLLVNEPFEVERAARLGKAVVDGRGCPRVCGYLDQLSSREYQ